MARISFAAHPFLLGFEQIDRILEKTIKSSNDGFPPYNIELSDDNHYKITLAVAGFSEDELSITLEERQLIISGKQVEKTNQNTFIYSCLLYTSPSPRDLSTSRMPSSA